MNQEPSFAWPSGDCKPIIATLRTPSELVANTTANTFRDKDDLDWFEGAYLRIDGLGAVLIMKHDNNPAGLTALYVDLSCQSCFAGTQLREFFRLSPDDVTWQTEV